MSSQSNAMERLLPTLVWAETHLDGDLSLDALAGVAGLSPHYFHRVFRENIGETAKKYVERLRLDRSAFLLAVQDRSILEIALDVGFQNHETFSRAFKRRFRTTPSAFRDRWQNEAMNGGGGRSEGLEETRPIGELSATRIRKHKEMHVAFVRHTGNYEDVPPTIWDEVIEWVGDAGRDGERWLMGIGHDAPGLTPAEELRFDACVLVSKPFKPKGRIGYQSISAGHYAMTTHVGPFSTLSAAWAEVFERVFEMDSYPAPKLPAIEMYHATQINPDYVLNRTELCLPLDMPA